MKRLEDAHFSWVGPYCPPLEENTPAEFLERSQQMVRKMGYQFRLTKVVAPVTVRNGGKAIVELEGENEGVAPFYYKWPVRLALISSKNRVVASSPVEVDIRKWLPGRFRSKLVANVQAPAGEYRLALGVIDPWTGRPAIRFANRLAQVDGWTVLRGVRVVK
jgi:hypothetical protein